MSDTVQHLMLNLTINGTEMRFPVEEFYFTASQGALWWYDCKMCRGMTQHPAGHLEWHLLKGDYGLTPNDQNGEADEQQHQT